MGSERTMIILYRDDSGADYTHIELVADTLETKCFDS
jgi:hypothetical protein